MPRGMWLLLAALGAFAALVLGVLAWAQFSGNAGSQRGLVVHSDLSVPVGLEIEKIGQLTSLEPGRERTFVVRRDQLPATFRVFNTEGARSVLFERRFTYDDLADAEFRISIDAEGFHRTQDVRDEDIGRVTPAATPA